MLMAFPELLLAILIAAALGGSFWNIVVVLTVAFTPGFASAAETPDGGIDARGRLTTGNGVSSARSR